MKKLHFYCIMILLSFSVTTTTAYAADKHATTTTKEVPAEIQTMLDRLEEIKDMDKSSLKSSEKKELRKEVRAIKQNLKSSGHGIYLSVGAIIIIILLLILLL